MKNEWGAGRRVYKSKRRGRGMGGGIKEEGQGKGRRKWKRDYVSITKELQTERELMVLVISVLASLLESRKCAKKMAPPYRKLPPAGASPEKERYQTEWKPSLELFIGG